MCKIKKTLADYPELVAQLHPTQNGNINPEDIKHGSDRKIWWFREECGHEWDAKVYFRTHQSTGCPFCTGKKVCLDMCLAIKNPEIMEFWNYERNSNITPYEITPYCHKKAWFICSKGHEWYSSIFNTVRGNRCPYCSGNKVCVDNCLKTLYPDKASLWDYNKNGDLTPNDVTHGSKKMIWCKCPNANDHEWRTTVNMLTRSLGCPYCMGRKICPSNCFATTHPEILKFWHINKNKKITPYNITYGSTKKIWLQCPINKDHIWKTTPNNFTYGKRCPHCNTSKGEQRIKDYLIKNNINFETQYKFTDCKNILPLPFDFYIRYNHVKILIEYQGKQHYEPYSFNGKRPNTDIEGLKKIQNRDKIKFDYCISKNIPLIIIKYCEFNNIEVLLSKFLSNISQACHQ